MALGPSDTIDLAVTEALSVGGDFSSNYASALATAAANLVGSAGAEAAAVPVALAEVGGWRADAAWRSGLESQLGCAPVERAQDPHAAQSAPAPLLQSLAAAASAGYAGPASQALAAALAGSVELSARLAAAVVAVGAAPEYAADGALASSFAQVGCILWLLSQSKGHLPTPAVPCTRPCRPPRRPSRGVPAAAPPRPFSWR